MGVLVFAFTHTSSAQLITKSKDNVYAYDGKIYKYDQLENIIKESSLSYASFHRAIKRKKLSRQSGYVALGSLAVGASIISHIFSSKSCYDECFGLDYLGAGLVVFVLPISGMISLISLEGSKKDTRKSIDYFNQSQIIGIDESKQLQWTVGITQNGLRVAIIV